MKDLKKLYKGHLNGIYRFLIGNSENCSSKLWKMHFFVHFFCTLSKVFRYFRWEIDMFRLNVLYITFWDLSNGIYGFSYKWIWKLHFLKSWSKPYRNITKDPRTWVWPGCGVADFRISLCHPNVYQNLLFNALGAMTLLSRHWLLV